MPHDEGLTADQVSHGEQMRAHLEREIGTAGGWIGFERYMDMALYAPGLGYYAAGSRKIGRGGDFTTAPEVSRLFGACIANQCAEVFDELGGGSILEIGAGTGRLAVDTLTRLAALRRLPERYLILEVSADLRERQRSLIVAQLPGLVDRVEWLDEPPLQAFDGVILANEVLDALPVSRFRWDAAACSELGVAHCGGRFGWAPRPADTRLAARVRALAAAHDWEPGYVSELCPRLGDWARSMVRPLRRGAALWFDYGLPRSQYYLNERHGGTLICHFRQGANEDPFLRPGLQDITAWVDFTALAEACVGADCELAGFTTQAFFLAGLGIDREMRELAGDDENRFARLANEAKRLMLPGEMGERFKAMAWTRGLERLGIERDLSGFVLQDLRHSL